MVPCYNHNLDLVSSHVSKDEHCVSILEKQQFSLFLIGFLN